MAGVGALHSSLRSPPSGRPGVVHRDLKPANILLAREGGALVPKIADLGVGRPTPPGSGARPPPTPAALGPPPDMAPEQLRDSSRVDHRADIWALGVILFEMLCGRRPFPGSTLQEIAAAIDHGPPDPLDFSPMGVAGGLPRAWEEALLAARHRWPSQLQPALGSRRLHRARGRADGAD